MIKILRVKKYNNLFLWIKYFVLSALTDPNRSEASREWNHWKITFDNFVAFFVACHEHKLYYNLLSFWRAVKKTRNEKKDKK